MFHSLWRGLRSFFYWLPVIWRDYDWDWEPILILLRHKLQKMSLAFVGEKTLSADAPSAVRQMQLCIKLIERILADKYWRMVIGRYYRRFGSEPSHKVQDGIFRTDWPSEEARVFWVQCANDAEEIRQLDCSRLFGIMAKYLRWWWD